MPRKRTYGEDEFYEEMDGDRSSTAELDADELLDYYNARFPDRPAIALADIDVDHVSNTILTSTLSAIESSQRHIADMDILLAQSKMRFRDASSPQSMQQLSATIKNLAESRRLALEESVISYMASLRPLLTVQEQALNARASVPTQSEAIIEAAENPLSSLLSELDSIESSLGGEDDHF